MAAILEKHYCSNTNNNNSAAAAAAATPPLSVSHHRSFSLSLSGSLTCSHTDVASHNKLLHFYKIHLSWSWIVFFFLSFGCRCCVCAHRCPPTCLWLSGSVCVLHLSLRDDRVCLLSRKCECRLKFIFQASSERFDTKQKDDKSVCVLVWGGSVVWGRGGEVAPSDFYCYSSFYSSQMATQSPVHHTEPPLFSLSLFPPLAFLLPLVLSLLPLFHLSSCRPDVFISSLSRWSSFLCFPLSFPSPHPLFPLLDFFSQPIHPVNQLLHSLLHFASSVSRIKKLKFTKM